MRDQEIERDEKETRGIAPDELIAGDDSALSSESSPASSNITDKSNTSDVKSQSEDNQIRNQRNDLNKSNKNPLIHPSINQSVRVEEVVSDVLKVTGKTVNFTRDNPDTDAKNDKRRVGYKQDLETSSDSYITDVSWKKVWNESEIYHWLEVLTKV